MPSAPKDLGEEYQEQMNALVEAEEQLRYAQNRVCEDTVLQSLDEDSMDKMTKHFQESEKKVQGINIKVEGLTDLLKARAQ